MGEIERAEAILAAGVRISSLRGEFFSALALCRLHLPVPLQAPLVRELAERFAVDRRPPGQPVPAPATPPRHILLPTDEKALLEMASSVGEDLEGVGLPPHAPLPNVPLFGELQSEEFAELAMLVAPMALQPGQHLIQQGDTDRTFYLLSHGSVEVIQQRPNKQKITLAEIQAPTFIGEMSLLTTVARRASVVSKGAGVAWRIDAELMSALAHKNPKLISILHQLIKQRQIHNLFRLSDVFSSVETKDNLLRAFRLRVVEVDERVFEQGSPPPGLFVILHGEAVVMAQTEDGRRVHLATLSEGDTFGEFSLLTNEPTSASVWMPDGGIVLHLPAESYRLIRRLEPNLEKALRRLMDMRTDAMRDILQPASHSFEDLDTGWLQQPQSAEAELPV
jgi:CRP-like cAMP-binding protein